MANDEMVQGYQDGLNMDNPEPSDNRSHSYRHGFANGRADANQTTAFASVAAAKAMADIAIEKDASV